MAATTTADMKPCHRQLGRPPISDTDKRQRQQEAYKKRDASRVYLASSYERWKRLGGQLGLKDSSLAWHLMEAHATNCDECGLGDDKSAEDESNMECQKNPSQFFPALVRSIHKLCHRYYSFGDCVQVVGLICLEVDNGKKENFSIKEMVHKPFMFQLGKNNNDCTNNKHNDLSMNNKCSKDEHFSDDSENDESDHGIGEDFMETDQLSPTDKDKSHGEDTGKDFGLENGIEDKVGECKELNNSTQSDERDSSFISVGDEEYDVNKNHKENVQTFSPITHNVDLYPDHPRIYTDTEYPIQGSDNFNHNDDDHVQADTTEDSADDSINKLVICDTNETTQDTSLPLSLDGNIPQSKCDNSLSNNNSFSNNAFIEETPQTKENLSYPPIQSKPEMCNNSKRGIPQQQDDFTVSTPEDNNQVEQRENDREVEVDKEIDSGDQTNFKQLDIQIPPESCLGLDLSVVKTEIQDNFQSPDNMGKSNRKRKSSEMEPLDKEASGTSHFSPSYLSGNTRREIVYKVEYEHLEKNPFCDFYELTARYPNIQQRTFYRWKRKIKDEFIFLEQNSDLTFEQFCACVSHAKPEVFEIWKKLIKDGHRFSSLHVSPSDTSPTQASSKKPDVYNASLAILQMYPHMSFQEFSYTHPMISNEVFLSYKQQVLSAISHVEQNPNLEYNELIKQYKFITEDAFNAWKKYAQMINAQKVMKPVKEERCDKPTQADLYAMQSAMLQQYPMLMGTAGFAAYNALLNQAMASSTSGGQFYPALMQAAVNQAHHQYLPNQWQQSSLAGVPQSILQAQQQLLKQTPQQSSLSKLQSLTQVLCNNMKECDKSSQSSTSPDNTSPVPADNTLKKQNKNEYLYFIYHPDITYSEFNLHYPHISNRTFYRWKKEVKNAQNVLSDNPHYTYEELCSDFPNIPQDIFESWKIKKNKIRNSPQKVWRPHDTNISTTASSQDAAIREPNRILKAVLENDNPTDIIKIPQYKPLEYQHYKHKAVEDSPPKALMRSEEFEYVQLNPTISFNHFETIFSNITEEQFNQWKQHINDCMNLIYTNPDMSYNKFQSIVPDISEDVFNRWKYYQVSTNTKPNEDRNHFLSPKHADKDIEKIPGNREDESTEEEKCLDSKSNPSHNKQRKQARAEYLCLQENPFVDLQEVISAFPSVSKRTLYRWKKEILQAVEFVRSQPEISYNSFIQFFPEVLESNFNRWKKAINAASSALDDFQHKQIDHQDQNQEVTRQHESPTVSPNMADNCYEGQSEPSSIPETYTHQDNNEQDGSSTSSKPDDLSSPEMDDLPRCERRDFKYILENPDIDFEKFNTMFPNTLQYNFYKWRNDIHRWISLIMSSPHIDYNIFSIYCQEVPEDIFNEWRKAAIQNINGQTGTTDQSSYKQTTEDVDHTLSSTEMNNNEINNSTLTNSTYFKSLKTLTPRSRKVNLREYHYFIQNPYMTFQELNEMFNTISGRTFYRWKKEVKEKLEYLEINHDADFKGFSKLFPEVSEDVFLTWKQKAKLNCSKRTASGGGGNWWNVNHQPNGEEQKPVVASESSKDSFESQTSSRYTVMKEEEDREVNETTVKSPASPINYCSQKRLLNSSYEKEEKYMKRDGESQYTDTSNTIQQMLHQYSNNYINYGITPNSSMYSQILTSTSPYMMNPGIKHENSTHNLASSASIFPTNANLPNLPNLPKRPLSSPMTSISPSTNCDEIYSPKFRKRQREEYCYLQQNPTMDFNEFTSHFPRVSIRTFYRWKKELKDDR